MTLTYQQGWKWLSLCAGIIAHSSFTCISFLSTPYKVDMKSSAFPILGAKDQTLTRLNKALTTRCTLPAATVCLSVCLPIYLLLYSLQLKIRLPQPPGCWNINYATAPGSATAFLKPVTSLWPNSIPLSPKVVDVQIDSGNFLEASCSFQCFPFLSMVLVVPLQTTLETSYLTTVTMFLFGWAGQGRMGIVTLFSKKHWKGRLTGTQKYVSFPTPTVFFSTK